MRRHAVSVTALLVILVGSLVAYWQQGISWFSTTRNRMEATLVVRDANGLVPHSRVLLRGVPVGEVAGVQAAADGVSVRFWYPDSLQLPVDSEFRIDSLSVLGESYLSIKPRSDSGPILVDNQQIIADDKTVSGTFGEQIVAATRLLRDLEPTRINSVIAELNTALSDTSVIPVIANASAKVRDDIANNKNELRNILRQSQTLLQNSETAEAILPTMAAPTMELGKQVQIMVETIIALLYAGDYPEYIANGTKPLINRLIKFSDDTNLNMYNFTNPLLPPMQATASAFATLDVSRLLDASMSTAEAPGAFTVHVTPAQ
ncbi:Mce family protein [Mycobacteroides abscessus subsp. massiliense]|uniref:MlaD family protein n=1 Tax=Mycobacteroides abscessus TaxID=36809 RepID=UPI0009A5985A|nr:MlaD family protein [Mycobacteroides abscessus]SKR01471.1 Mce family protein [Mycobacteroides abscessus subsp. massiliense]SKR64199.1 Mce family protein [Mycobacteroides abscessus subsp. massiliense]SKT47976.1 Mce family protein [Mycobacteroides abscessus subsp. massiliense]SKT85551.1 Mce family protein [Mycobacteroides abscessus subsp. massiliense]SLA27725.1 Mce family protein [Mycobacteroides abscessus subsp. massiliense]